MPNKVVDIDLIPLMKLKVAGNIYLQGLFDGAITAQFVKLPLPISQFGQNNVVHQELLCAIADYIDKQATLHVYMINSLSGISRNESLLQY